MKEAEQWYLTTNLQDIATSRTASENGSTSPQPDQQVNTSNTIQAQIHVVDKTNQQTGETLDSFHPPPADSFQTPTSLTGR